MSVIEIDRGWKRIKQELKRIDNSAVNVGVLQSAGSYEGGQSIATIAVANELGVPSKRIPPRPFMHIAFDDNKSQLETKTSSLKDDIYSGRATTRKALGILGEMHTGHIKMVIGSDKLEPNAPSTIRRKKTTKPLIEKGRLLGSITYEVDLK